MCEEVQQPSIQVPKAMVGTVILNTFAGLLFLIPLVFVLPDIQMLVNLASGQPVPPILKDAIGSSGGAFGLLVPLIVLAIMCGIGCTTATSRCTWAFARDGAIPGSKWWMKVNRKLDVPLNAMMLSMAVQIILGLIYFGSPAAFNAFSGVGVICLTASYACPIAISLFAGRKKVTKGRFYLGPLGTFCNVVAIGACPLPNFFHVSLSCLSCSLVSAGVAALLHALPIPCHRRNRQLCARRLCRCNIDIRSLVLGLGAQKLCRSANTRGLTRYNCALLRGAHAYPFFFTVMRASYEL